MVCSSRLERVPHGLDLRLKKREREARKLLANQPAYWWLKIQVPIWALPAWREKSQHYPAL